MRLRRVTVRPSGVQVILCEWKHRVHLLAARIMLVGGIGTTLVALLLHVTLRKHIHAFVTSRVTGVVSSGLVASTLG